ncbi:MAG: superoxide dismutase family protein [Novosphingobium sp.]
MSNFRTMAVSALLIGATAASAQTKPPAPLAQPLASAPLFTQDGRDAGYAVIVVRRDKATLRIAATSISEGEHGLHFHTTGSCKGPKFAGAGGHLNPMNAQHGAKNPAGSHMGDLPNVTADASGLLFADIPLNGSAKALAAQMFDKDGTAIVLHAAPDDYMTDPSGNSGDRIACGVFKKN